MHGHLYIADKIASPNSFALERFHIINARPLRNWYEYSVVTDLFNNIIIARRLTMAKFKCCDVTAQLHAIASELQVH